MEGFGSPAFPPDPAPCCDPDGEDGEPALELEPLLPWDDEEGEELPDCDPVFEDEEGLDGEEEGDEGDPDDGGVGGVGIEGDDDLLAHPPSTSAVPSNRVMPALRTGSTVMEASLD